MKMKDKLDVLDMILNDKEDDADGQIMMFEDLDSS